MARQRTGKSTIGRDPWESVIPVQHEEPAEPPPAVVRKRGRPRTRVVDSQATVSAPPTNVIPPAEVAPAVERVAVPTPPVTPEPPPEPTAQAGVGGSTKLTVHLDPDLVNRVKNAAYWNPRLTIARIAESGIRLALEEVEKQHGGPYPQRERELVGGRPIR